MRRNRKADYILVINNNVRRPYLRWLEKKRLHVAMQGAIPAKSIISPFLRTRKTSRANEYSNLLVISKNLYLIHIEKFVQNEGYNGTKLS